MYLRCQSSGNQQISRIQQTHALASRVDDSGDAVNRGLVLDYPVGSLMRDGLLRHFSPTHISSADRRRTGGDISGLTTPLHNSHPPGAHPMSHAVCQATAVTLLAPLCKSRTVNCLSCLFLAHGPQICKAAARRVGADFCEPSNTCIPSWPAQRSGTSAGPGTRQRTGEVFLTLHRQASAAGDRQGTKLAAIQMRKRSISRGIRL